MSFGNAWRVLPTRPIPRCTTCFLMASLASMTSSIRLPTKWDQGGLNLFAFWPGLIGGEGWEGRRIDAAAPFLCERGHCDVSE